MKLKYAETDAGVMQRASLERIADLFKVFGDATRLAIVQELKGGALNVGELVERLEQTWQPRALYDAHWMKEQAFLRTSWNSLVTLMKHLSMHLFGLFRAQAQRFQFGFWVPAFMAPS